MTSWRSSATFAAGVACLCAGGVLGVRVWQRGRPALTVRAVAHQWWWEFDYPTLGVRTSDALHVPSDSVVRFVLTSADVVHSFWMPGMHAAVAVVPGRSNVLDLAMGAPGESYGTCDATCGCGTGCMRFAVVASAPEDFRRWAARRRAQPAAASPLHPGTVPRCAAADATLVRQ